MATPVNMPKLGMSMTEATLIEWEVDEEMEVVAGDIICRIETDKVEQDVEAPVGGVIRLKATVGEVYPVGELIAEID